ncbi:MAG: hypothetical protein ABSG63_00035 [Spirochaetia bacterium]
MILILKLLLTPFFIAMVSLADRRWGPRVSGLLIGLPLTSGPISFLLAVEHGPKFAVSAAAGTLCGEASLCLFCLAYAWSARRLSWPLSSLIGVSAYAAATLAWSRFPLGVLPAAGVLAAVVVAVLILMPRGTHGASGLRHPKWDLPARMAVAEGFVLLITGLARSLGPLLSGLLSPYPVFGNVLASFTHHQRGGEAAGSMLRGVVLGGLGFLGFFLVVGLALVHIGLGWTYLLASAAAIGVNGLSLAASRMRQVPRESA